MISDLDLDIKARQLRLKLGAADVGPINIFSLCQNIDDLTLVFYPLGRKISGICYKSPSSNLIAINSVVSLGRQRFSLAHELYHLYYDTDDYSISTYKASEEDENEANANKFASLFLVPPISLREQIKNIKDEELNRKLSKAEVIKLGQFFGVSHKAMLYMLVEMGELTEFEADVYRDQVRDAASKLGYDISLYESTAEEDMKRIYGHYVKIANTLHDEKLISPENYDEVINLKFMDEIVNG